jgi:chromosome segregation ATPase
MKRASFIVGIVCWLAFVAAAPPARAQTTGASQSGVSSHGREDAAGLLQQLAAEVRKLRSELLEQRLENHELKIALLKNELEQERARQQQLEEEERTLNQEDAEAEKQLGQAELIVADREQLEATKSELARRLERLRSEQQKSAERKTQLLELLERAEQQRQTLLERARKFATEAGETSNGSDRPAPAARRIGRE